MVIDALTVSHAFILRRLKTRFIAALRMTDELMQESQLLNAKERRLSSFLFILLGMRCGWQAVHQAS